MKIRATLVLLSAAALAAAACGKNEAPAAAPPPVVTALLGTAERESRAARIEIAGTVAAEKSAAVSGRVMAAVTAVHVQLGDPVRAGQLLVTIDPAVSRGQLAQAQGALAQAEAALALAERNFFRFEGLAARQAASELELDLARMQREQARGAVEQARGAVEAARAVAADSRVVAPFAGRVSARLVEVGDLAAPGRPLVMLESAGGRRVVLAVPEGLAASVDLRPGARLPVRVDARPELGEIDGEIVEVSPGPDPLTHSYTVKVALAGGEVSAGSAARALLAGAERSVVLVPEAALVRSGGLDLVVVRDETGQAQTHVVTLGTRLGDGRIEVLSGLAGGERIALGLAAAPPAGARLEEGRS